LLTAAGFTEAELMGQPHNIIRHPDMPPEAFAIFGPRSRPGKRWAARSRTGARTATFTGVLAQRDAIVENGQVTGYMSIRSQAVR